MRKLNSWSGLVSVLTIALAIVLFTMVPEVHAQEGDPPPTQEPEIVGGAPATAGEWPWQVALIDGGAVEPFRDDQFCGGSLIHPEWVLTAAHCITNGSGAVVAASSVDIVAGIYNLASPAAGYQQRDVTQIIRHPSYNDSTTDNDIALLHLASPVTIGGSGETATALVPLVSPGIGSLTGTNSWVTGWGTMSYGGSVPDQLYEVQVPIIANSVCNDASHYPGAITSNMMCAGYEAGGYDSCQGDSGGPLVVSDGGQWKLAGLVSWGGVCAAPRRPGVYTRVSQYGSWVNQNIGQTTLVSPSSTIGTNTPTYTWNAVNTMTYYYLWVNGPSGNNVIANWYTAAEAGCGSGTGTCSVTPSTMLAGGVHNWWVQTWNPAGSGPWSVGMSFTAPTPPLPGAATLVSPTGSIGDNNPTYTWNKVTDASWYYMSVSGPSGYAFTKWYDASAVCGETTCSAAGATPSLAAGAYTWKVQTWNSVGYGPWSADMGFNVPVPTPPGQATLVSPTGSIGNNNPTYTWNKVSASTWYYLSVSGPSGYAFTKWYDASAVCGETTCSAVGATPNLAGGAYTWKVQTWNSVGYGPWSADMSFNVPVPTPPGQATLVSPTGSIDNSNPTYTWNKVTDSTWYYMSVSGPSGYAFTKWYDASAVCGESTCSAANATPGLAPGAYTWKVQTWSSVGYGPWSADMGFNVPVPTPPGGATLVSPTGSIGDNNPTYTWNKVSASTWYYMSVSGPSGYAFTQWYGASAVCGESTCSAVGATPGLAPGAYTWKVQTWNSAGFGPWSSDMSFSIPIPWPAQPTLISPDSSTTDLTPTYSWNAVSSETGNPATWYYLSVDASPGGNMLAKWYTAEEAGCVSGTGTCTVTQSTPLIPGPTYTWNVYGWNSGGAGPASASMSFSLVALLGFDSQFNTSSTGWSVAGGQWNLGTSWWISRFTGAYKYYSNSSYYNPSTYANFDYSARLIRTGCVWCDNSLYVRGNPTLDSVGFWTHGYQFAYTDDGYFSVWKIIGGSFYTVQDYTYTSAIVQGNWNVLRVIAIGNQFYFYINGTLVWSGTDSSIASGYVGVAMDNFEDNVTAGDLLYVDWATVNYYTETLLVITDTVSPEQQALNDAANAGGSDKTDGGNHPR